MSNAKKIEAAEHERRQEKYMQHFNNAAEVLDNQDFENRKMLKALPKDARVLELLTQYFMANALGDTRKYRILDKLHDYIGPAKAQPFSTSYLDAVFARGKRDLTPATPE